ncbi:MAG: DNA alkylation repair protein [Actinomycetota bacterium]
MTDLDEILDSIERYFVASADPERAEPMASYMRDQFPFYGIGAKDRADILTTVFAERPPPPDEEGLGRLVDACLARPQREWHYAAVAVLRRHRRRLTGASWPAVHRIATTHAWWDTIDEVAKHVAGRIVKNVPPEVAVMDRWIGDDDMWVARIAILHQLAYKETTDVERLFAYCDRRADETDFFYRKAIGWALRQYAHTDPVAVQDYVDRRRDRLSPLSIREATKHL